jgi:hypothetical protein
MSTATGHFRKLISPLVLEVCCHAFVPWHAALLDGPSPFLMHTHALRPLLYQIFAETCQYMPNCYLGDVDGSKACLPTFVKGYSSYQFFELIAAFNALDPQVFGNCEAVCWVRQVRRGIALPDCVAHARSRTPCNLCSQYALAC